VEFEFDPEKSRSNKIKHGIDFEAAQQLWEDPNGIEFDSQYVNEPRILRISEAQGGLWTAVFTKRGDKIRIISVRRAREDEREKYANDNG